ncbi:MAG: acyl-CoA dehydrogenase family protein, partial [Myxococcales bacterium]|nr:acyl-CoA dehydrogenase family protein [Myxococcales bacterium]
MFPEFTAEHEIFRKSVRSYCEKEIAPHVDEWERERFFPNSVFREMGKLGFLGVRVDPKYGGSGLDWWYSTVLCEELPRMACSAIPMAIMVQTDMATPIISDVGTEEQKERWLPGVCSGEKIWAIGVSEPGAGSDVANIRTTAVRDGDHYVINGAKTFITNGARADFITLACKTKPDAGYAGVSMIVVPTDTPGFKVSRKLEKIGNHASDTAELSFENMRVPVENLLGEENHGFYYQMQNFQSERLVAGISGVAGAQLLLNHTIEYCKTREAFGRPISKFQVNRHKIVDMQTQIEAARALLYMCVDKVANGVDAVKEISMVKLFIGDMIQKINYECLQLHGG